MVVLHGNLYHSRIRRAKMYDLKSMFTMFVVILCIIVDTKFMKATNDENIYEQIMWGIYLIVGIIVLVNIYS